MSRYPMTDPITIPPFPQNKKEVHKGLLFFIVHVSNVYSCGRRRKPSPRISELSRMLTNACGSM